MEAEAGGDVPGLLGPRYQGGRCVGGVVETEGRPRTVRSPVPTPARPGPVHFTLRGGKGGLSSFQRPDLLNKWLKVLVNTLLAQRP